jgi:acetylornithine deacetylase
MWRTTALLLCAALTRTGVATSNARQQQSPFQLESAATGLNLTHDLIAFHKNLTQIESITGNEYDVGQWLIASLKAQGYSTERQYVDKQQKRFNVFAYPGKVRDAKVLVTSHIDTVRCLSRRLLGAASMTRTGLLRE